MQTLLLAGAASLARKMCVKVPVLTSYHRKTFFSPPRLCTSPAIKFIDL